jgi:hypothetical protein
VTIRRHDIDELLRTPAPPCTSVFLTLEHRGTGDEEDRARLALLLDDAAGALRSWGLRWAAAEDVVGPLRRALDEAPWPSGWRGLALFGAPGLARWHGLCSPVADRAVIGDRFLVGPLIRELERSDGYWLLALSRNRPRLLRGGAAGLHAVALDPALPTFGDVVATDDAEEVLAYHRGSGGPARSAVTYHGHGGLADADDARNRRWLEVLASRVDTELSGERRPLVLAGVTELVAAYRRITRYEHLSGRHLPGSPDRTGLAELHERSRPIVVDLAATARRRDVERVHERAGTGWTLSGLGEVAEAAAQGRIDVLFAPVDPSPEDELTVDAAIVATWQAGGTVHITDEAPPGDGTLTAILRYVPTPAVRPRQRVGA